MVALLARQCSVRKCLLSRTQCRDVVFRNVLSGAPRSRAAAYILQPYIHNATQACRRQPESVVTAQLVPRLTTAAL